MGTVWVRAGFDRGVFGLEVRKRKGESNSESKRKTKSKSKRGQNLQGGGRVRLHKNTQQRWQAGTGEVAYTPPQQPSRVKLRGVIV